jgi:hypothetical protein
MAAELNEVAPPIHALFAFDINIKAGYPLSRYLVNQTSANRTFNLMRFKPKVETSGSKQNARN